jgi:hypothetical protein
MRPERAPLTLFLAESARCRVLSDIVELLGLFLLITPFVRKGWGCANDGRRVVRMVTLVHAIIAVLFCLFVLGRICSWKPSPSDINWPFCDASAGPFAALHRPPPALGLAVPTLAALLGHRGADQVSVRC